MTPKTKCTACGVEILQTTADARGGLCAPCAKGTRAQIDAGRLRASEPALPRISSPTVDPSAAAISLVLDDIVDPESEQDLALLEGALAAIHAAPDAPNCAPALFRVLERFPWSDGFELFWGIIHTLEALPGYAPLLLVSVCTSPGEFNLLMVNRLLNGGIREVEGVSLVRVLQEVSNGPGYSEQARAQARSFLEHQRRSRGLG